MHLLLDNISILDYYFTIYNQLRRNIMKYKEISLDTPADKMDNRCDELTSLGVDGFVIENEADFRDFLENSHQYWDYVDECVEKAYMGVSRIKFYLTDDADGEAVLERVLSAFPMCKVSETEDKDWENDWKNCYEPIEVGERLVVVPEWLDVPDDGRTPLRLDPGIAFGTGSHPTTKLSLAALEGYAAEGVKVLDLGCGSGILGIGALVLGCDSCVGCDVDPKAKDAAMMNAALNGIGEDRIKIYAGDILKDGSMRRTLGTDYPLVLANIVADVIISLSAFVRQFMSEAGTFICSGVIDDRWKEVSAALTNNGFEIISHTQEEEWHCFVCR